MTTPEFCFNCLNGIHEYDRYILFHNGVPACVCEECWKMLKYEKPERRKKHGDGNLGMVIAEVNRRA